MLGSNPLFRIRTEGGSEFEHLVQLLTLRFLRKPSKVSMNFRSGAVVNSSDWITRVMMIIAYPGNLRQLGRQMLLEVPHCRRSQSASPWATALLDKLRGPDPKAPTGSRSPQDLLCAEPANRFEANFANSFSVPNKKSLFSFITLRKKWFLAANFDRNSDNRRSIQFRECRNPARHCKQALTIALVVYVYRVLTSTCEASHSAI